MEKVAVVMVFFRVLRFPSQFSFNLMLHTRLSSGAGRIDPVMVDVTSGLSVMPPHEIKI
jgi:hypothetical protein